MSALQEFETYLGRFAARLKALAVAQGVAVAAATGTFVTIVAVALADRFGFPADIVIAGRLALLAALAFALYFGLLRPRRELEANAASAIETRAPAFGGRVDTFSGMPDSGNPLRELLAEDALRIARAHPPASAVPEREFRLAWLGAGAALAVLLFLAIAGPGNYAFGVRQLWVGWAFPGLLPPQSVEVKPGDGGIRAGGNLAIEALPRGFAADAATVHVRFGDDDWQSVPMAAAGDAFEFVFFSVREPLEYYVAADHVRSPTYSIDVVDLPVVEKLVLTYRYPEWTRRDPEVRDPGGDVRAIGETEVGVRIVSDRPMTPADLVVGDESIPFTVDGESAQASFTIENDGQYYVAARVGGELIRLTDDYFITVEEDEPPSVEFARPGRDWSASRIEEVTTVVSAADDYGIESLTLNYSVNGGDWQSIDLEAAGPEADAEHVFFLESLGSEAPAEPGDLVAYYAIATDRTGSARTDMFFVDVQPFDKRYSQAQTGGQMGGNQGGQQDEISQRQREIIISTWNLIREQNEGQRGDDAYVTDNAALLARLQSTLKEQVETLARRSEARELTSSDPRIAQFVEELSNAAEAMGPAAERLGELDLEQALLPEQEALQHLLAAEAVFNDISVSMQANNRGGGGQAGRDLTEMFELEMDLEKNQYETGSRATAEPPQRELEETADELAELARRQERLAENRRSSRTPMPAQRWQQEMLRRDVEELRERLERMAEASARNRDGASDESGGPGQPESGSAQTPGAQGQGGQATADERFEREIDELRRRLDSAVRAMNDAGSAMEGATSDADLERAMQEAQRQLEGARDRATAVRQQALENNVADLAERAGSLHGTQLDLEEKLQEAVRRALEGDAADPDRLDSGMTVAEEFALASAKRELLAELERLQQDARNAARDLEGDQPRAAAAISDGVETVEEQQVEARLAVAAAYIEQGQGVYVASSESAVTEALRDLRENLDEAAELVAGQSGANGGGHRDALRAALSGTRELRRNLRRLSEGTPAGDGLPGESGTETGTETGASAAERDAGDENRPVRAATIGRELDRQIDGVAGEVNGLLRELAEAGADPGDIDELRRLSVAVGDARFSGNAELLERESRIALSLVEQLELALARSTRRDDGEVRQSTESEVPEAYREIVADYYRRLGSAGDDDR